MALYGATKSIRAGDHERANRMFRARIYAQGFTILALVAGSFYWKTDRQKRKEFEAALHEKNTQAKRDAWIRELEFRDQEERDFRAKKDKMMADKKMRRAEAERNMGQEGGVVDAVVDKTEEKGKGVVHAVQESLGMGGKKG